MTVKSFEDLGLSKGLCKILTEEGYETPTDIQTLAIPPLLAGQDLIGVAPTGTGKTLAYLLPVFQEIRQSKVAQTKGPVALVVTPSRELASQVAAVATQLAAGDDAVRIACIYGGAGLTTQRTLLQGNPHIVVGTPGRIREFYLSQDLVLKSVRFLILDEADRLMDMGFMPQLRAMLEVLPRKRQNLLFSATFNQRVEQASAEFLEWPVKVQAAKQATVPTTITEHFYQTPNLATKRNLLLDLIQRDEEGSGFIFCRSRQEANDVEGFLKQRNVKAEVLHANKGQNTRNKTLDDFKAGIVQWLVTTDVASRGLDVAAVPMVIQFALPLDIRDYIHRTGRTGRAGVAGICYTFIDPGDEARISPLNKLLGKQVPLEPAPEQVVVETTQRDEAIAYERVKDEVKRKLDPTFKGAFHEKKVPRPTPAPKKTGGGPAKKDSRKPTNGSARPGRRPRK